jgi:hypothetical protein
MDSIEMRISKSGLSFAIGANWKGFVCILTDFNPIRKIQLIDMIGSLPSVEYVDGVQMLGSANGQIKVKLHEGFDSNHLKNDIERLLQGLIV